YVWRDGAWRTLWERSSGTPEPLWSDDFTSPTLHERWMLLDGAYTPPGLTDAALLLGPPVDDACEVTFTANYAGGMATLTLLTPEFEQAVIVDQHENGQIVMVNGGGDNITPPGASEPGDRITLRRANGMFTVLVNGAPVTGTTGPLEAPD